ncbi:MAG: hypothetical protein AB7P40_21740 [Chloroflexota bacterium]
MSHRRIALEHGIPWGEIEHVILPRRMIAGFLELVTGLKRTREVIQAGK